MMCSWGRGYWRRNSNAELGSPMSTFSELEATSTLVLWKRSLVAIVTLGGPIPRNLSDSKHTDESNSRTYLKVAMAMRFATPKYFQMVSTRPHGMAKTVRLSALFFCDILK